MVRKPIYYTRATCVTIEATSAALAGRSMVLERCPRLPKALMYLRMPCSQAVWGRDDDRKRRRTVGARWRTCSRVPTGPPPRHP